MAYEEVANMCRQLNYYYEMTMAGNSGSCRQKSKHMNQLAWKEFHSAVKEEDVYYFSCGTHLNVWKGLEMVSCRLIDASLRERRVPCGGFLRLPSTVFAVASQIFASL